MRPKIIVVGSSNTDMFVRVPHLPAPGETVLGGQFITAQGGKGANQAMAAARLGADVTFVARLGRDSFGQESLKTYQMEGIRTDYIALDDTTPSGVALIVIDQKGENTIAVASGANARLSPQDILAAEPGFREASVLLIQLEIPIETVEASVDLAHKHGVQVILNPAPAARLPDALLKKIDLLTPNQIETALLADESSTGQVDRDAAALRMKYGIKNVVVTLGSKGALISGSHELTVPPFPVQPVDTTGAGDAFNGGLAVALARGENLPEAVRYANAVGALATLRAGAQTSLPTAQELQDFLKQNLGDAFHSPGGLLA